MKIAIVAYGFDPARRNNLLDSVRRLESAFPGSSLIFVSTYSVSRDEAVAWRDIPEVLQLIEHDNKYWEFGGYIQGLRVASELGFDGAVVVNDTVNVNHRIGALWRASFNSWVKRLSGELHPVMVGEVNHSASEFFVLGKRCDRWVRSSIFYINSPGIKVVLQAMPIVNLLENVEYSRNGLSVPESLVNEELQNYLNGWLGFSAASNVWYRARALQERGQYQFLAAKAAAIIHEKYMSGLICYTGGRLIDIYQSGLTRLAIRLERKIIAGWGSH